MSLLKYKKQLSDTILSISKETGHSRPALFVAFIRSFLSCRASIREFSMFRLYNVSSLGHSEFLSVSRCLRYCARFLKDATPQEKACVAEKHLFNETYHDFIHRDWLYIPDSTPEEIAAFVRRNSDFLMKASYSTQGKNIFRYHSEDLDPESFAREHSGEAVLLEAFIQQHPAMTELNPTTVNTVRLVTALYKNRVLTVGACLRVGGKDAIVDNFHQGGVAYPIDLETGIVCGYGRNFDWGTFLCHPSTGIIMPGFRIPHWDTLLQQAEAAARVQPSVGYIGWDIAVTPDGVDFVEGNIEAPDPVVIQFDRIDAYLRLRQFVRSVDREGGAI